MLIATLPVAVETVLNSDIPFGLGPQLTTDNDSAKEINTIDTVMWRDYS